MAARYSVPSNSDRIALIEMYFIGAVVAAIGVGITLAYINGQLQAES